MLDFKKSQQEIQFKYRLNYGYKEGLEMAIEWIPKFGDVKTLQGLSKLLVGPILVASFIANTGLVVENDIFSIAIPENGTFSEYWLYFIGIFIFKTIEVLFAFYFPVAIIKTFRYQLGPDWFHIFGVLGLTFGFCGIFSAGSIEFFKTVHPSTYYASIVAGFYLLSEKWSNEITQKID